MNLEEIRIVKMLVTDVVFEIVENGFSYDLTAMAIRLSALRQLRLTVRNAIVIGGIKNAEKVCIVLMTVHTIKETTVMSVFANGSKNMQIAMKQKQLRQ